MSTSSLVLWDTVALMSAVLLAGSLAVGWPRPTVRQKPGRIASQHLSWHFMLRITAAAAVCGLAASWLNPGNIHNLAIYFMALFLLPYAYLANGKGRQDERQFNDVILYAADMAMLLKQDGNVFVALNKVSEEVGEPLRSDLAVIASSLAEPRAVTQTVLEQMAVKYPYTIIRQLNILVMQLHYESDITDQRMLDAFQDDISRLSFDVRKNQTRRRVLRWQYIGLTAGCIISLWLLMGQLRGALNMQDGGHFSDVMLWFSVAVLAILFFVDQYFNTHTTRE